MDTFMAALSILPSRHMVNTNTISVADPGGGLGGLKTPPLAPIEL